ncbi:MAG: hypothetical protein JOY82_16530 [Streptosporangiaceae bacterium]|nr:hypothetical protein [Streptosporangiaceae bacterium]
MASREALSENLVTLMEAARQEYAAYLKSNSLPFTSQHAQMIIIDNEDRNGWRSDFKDVTQSTADSYLPSWPGLQEELKHRTLDLASDFVSTFTSTLPFWANPLGPYQNFLQLSNANPEFKSEPNSWIAQQILVPAMAEYLRSLESADTPNTDLANRIAAEAIDFVGSSKLRTRSSLPVSGIDMESDQLSVGDIVVRALTPRQRGTLWMQANSILLPAISRDMLYSTKGAYTLPSHVIQVTTSHPRMLQPQPGMYHQAALCAFFLHGYPLAGLGMMTSDTVPTWINWARMGVPIQLSAFPRGTKELRQDSLNEIWQTLKKLRNYNLDQPSNPRDLSLHRFLLGSIREDQADSLLDFTIALECIFLPYDPSTRQAELAYRFRLHGTHYISSSLHERRETWKRLRDLYDVRSRLVHGSEYPSAAEIAEKVEAARNLAQTALLKAVRSHFPRVEELTAMVLGEGLD